VTVVLGTVALGTTPHSNRAFDEPQGRQGCRNQPGQDEVCSPHASTLRIVGRKARTSGLRGPAGAVSFSDRERGVTHSTAHRNLLKQRHIQPHGGPAALAHAWCPTLTRPPAPRASPTTSGRGSRSRIR
jgi:hypothetical protein